MSTLESLTNHLKVLEQKHRDLDKKVTEDYEHRINNREYNKEKKEKLHLKEEIEARESCEEKESQEKVNMFKP